MLYSSGRRNHAPRGVGGSGGVDRVDAARREQRRSSGGSERSRVGRSRSAQGLVGSGCSPRPGPERRALADLYSTIATCSHAPTSRTRSEPPTSSAFSMPCCRSCAANARSRSIVTPARIRPKFRTAPPLVISTATRYRTPTVRCRRTFSRASRRGDYRSSALSTRRAMPAAAPWSLSRRYRVARSKPSWSSRIAFRISQSRKAPRRRCTTTSATTPDNSI